MTTCSGELMEGGKIHGIPQLTIACSTYDFGGLFVALYFLLLIFVDFLFLLQFLFSRCWRFCSLGLEAFVGLIRGSFFSLFCAVI